MSRKHGVIVLTITIYYNKHAVFCGTVALPCLFFYRYITVLLSSKPENRVVGNCLLFPPACRGDSYLGHPVLVGLRLSAELHERPHVTERGVGPHELRGAGQSLQRAHLLLHPPQLLLQRPVGARTVQQHGFSLGWAVMVVVHLLPGSRDPLNI